MHLQSTHIRSKNDLTTVKSLCNQQLNVHTSVLEHKILEAVGVSCNVTESKKKF